jgi:hypothetical protein
MRKFEHYICDPDSETQRKLSVTSHHLLASAALVMLYCPCLTPEGPKHSLVLSTINLLTVKCDQLYFRKVEFGSQSGVILKRLKSTNNDTGKVVKGSN